MPGMWHYTRCGSIDDYPLVDIRTHVREVRIRDNGKRLEVVIKEKLSKTKFNTKELNKFKK